MSCEVSHWGLKSFQLLEFISLFPRGVRLSLSITEEPNPDSSCAELYQRVDPVKSQETQVPRLPLTC